jgi:ABC-2 type transport system ATP-binding protein
VSGKLVVEGNLGTLSQNLFDGRSYEVQVSVNKDLGKPWKDAAQLLELPYVEKVTAIGQRATILCSKDVTPDLVRFFVAKEYDVTGVQRKEYDLDDIYQKYFETDLNESSQ